MNVETNAATSKHNGYNNIQAYSVRIKVKSIKHYRKCLDTLAEYDIIPIDSDSAELEMHRRPKSLKCTWLYLGVSGLVLTFFVKQPIRYAEVMTLKEFRKWRQSHATSG